MSELTSKLPLSDHKPTITFYIDDDTMHAIGYGDEPVVVDQPDALRDFTKFTKHNKEIKNQSRYEHGQNYIKELVQYPSQAQIIFASTEILTEI